MKITTSLLLILFFNLIFTASSAQNHEETIFVGDTIGINISPPDGHIIQWEYKTHKSNTWQKIINANDSIFLFEVPDSLTGKQLLLRALTEDRDSIECPKISEFIHFYILHIDSIPNRGQFVRGGILFHSELDRMYLAAGNSQGLISITGRWGCPEMEIPGADEKKMGFGKANTMDIVAVCDDPEGMALKCYNRVQNGYEDWFMPSINELDTLYKSIVKPGLYHFNDNWQYKSSTEFNQTRCLGLNRNNPRMIVQSIKAGLSRTIPVRTAYRKNSNIPIIKLNLKEIDESQNIHFKVIDSIEMIFEISYLGDTLGLDSFEWNFGRGNLISGSGGGPYLVDYQIGGKVEASLNTQFAYCDKSYQGAANYPVKNFKKLDVLLPAIFDGHMEWADLNSDGFSDLIISGSDTSFILMNNFGNDFYKSASRIENLNHTTIAAGDYNNNGHIDFVVSGFSRDDSVPKILFYENIKGDTFHLKNVPFPGVYNGYVEFKDINRDGFVDLFISGEIDSSTNYAGLFLNDGEAFRQTEFPAPPLNFTAGAWGDYNLNGYDDFIYSGIQDSTLKTLLFKNNMGSFEEIEHPFQNIYDGAMAWEDLDNDGLLDVVISGNKAIPRIYFEGTQRYVTTVDAVFTKAYRNNGLDSFSVFMGFGRWANQRCRSSLFLGDYDLDGFSDAFVTGSGPYFGASGGSGGSSSFNMTYHYNIKSSRSSIFKNLEGLVFQNIISDIPVFISSIGQQTSHNQYKSSFISGADFNNDNKIDFIREGASDGFTAAIYKNLERGNNLAPQSPASLYADLQCDTAFLTWAHSTDDHTPSHVLAYDVYIGSEPGKCDIVSKVNDYNLQDTFFILNRSLPAGTYYWSIRTKDNAKIWGDWAPEQSFTIELPETPEIWSEGDTLYSNMESGNQWHDESGPIPGATDQTYVITKSGTYYNILNQNGCVSDTSNILEVFLTKTHTPEWADQTSIYPNPFRDNIRISSNNLNGTIQYEIHNPLGQIIQKGRFRNEIWLNTTNWPNGAYSVKLIWRNKKLSKKIIKQQ